MDDDHGQLEEKLRFKSSILDIGFDFLFFSPSIFIFYSLCCTGSSLIIIIIIASMAWFPASITHSIKEQGGGQQPVRARHNTTPIARSRSVQAYSVAFF